MGYGRVSRGIMGIWGHWGRCWGGEGGGRGERVKRGGFHHALLFARRLNTRGFGLVGGKRVERAATESGDRQVAAESRECQ